MTPTIKAVSSYPVSIFIAGDVNLAKTICREFCDREGLCVTVTPTTYVFTGGEEDGVIIGLINYPRFPTEPGQLQRTAAALAQELREKLEQTSFTIQTPELTTWSSWRSMTTTHQERSE